MKNISRYILIIVAILIIGGIVYYLSDIVAYVLIAWVLSMLGQPLMQFFQHRLKIGKFHVGPITSAILTILIFLLIFSLLIFMFVPLIVEQANNLARVDYAAIATALEEPIQELNDWAANMGIIKTGKAPSEQVQEALSGWFEPSRIGNIFSSALGFAGNFLISFFSIIFITFFFLKEQGLFVNFLTMLVPNEYEQKVKQSVEQITTMLSRYFGGITLQVFIITLFVSVALSLLGVKNALLIGFFAALINVIPYLGPVIGASFAIFITISSNLDLDFYTQMLPLILKVAGVFATMQLCDNFILQPYIFSNSVSAHPLEIFLVIMVGAKIAGVVGMILAIPAYTVIRVIASVFLSEFKIVQQVTDRMGLEQKKKNQENV